MTTGIQVLFIGSMLFLLIGGIGWLQEREPKSKIVNHEVEWPDEFASPTIPSWLGEEMRWNWPCSPNGVPRGYEIADGQAFKKMYGPSPDPLYAYLRSVPNSWI